MTGGGRMNGENRIPADPGIGDETLLRAAAHFGTPLFVYDEGVLRRKWERLRNLLPPCVDILYSVKANPAVDVIAAFAALGCGFDVASQGEAAAVSLAGGNHAKSVWVGPGKSEGDLRFAAGAGIGVLAVESEGEFGRVCKIAEERPFPPLVALRLNPGGGGGSLSMSGATQFGADFDTAVKLLSKESGRKVEISGVHGYLGTGLLDARKLAANMGLVLREAERLQRATGRLLSFVDAGGGFGVPLYPGDAPLDEEILTEELYDLFGRYLDRHPWTEGLFVESGRFLTAEAGVMVARVLDVKRVHGRNFAIVDGGINAIGGRDGYLGSKHPPLRILGKEGEGDTPYTVCGPLCTPMDRLAVNVRLREPKEGDLVAFYMAGAYGPSASPGRFLCRGFPEEVIFRGGGLTRCRTVWGGGA
ncbi:diaminopimelate decarboxylase [bacterium]|nr:MAG: diaminopimelate decarboxylase [bacterium]